MGNLREDACTIESGVIAGQDPGFHSNSATVLPSQVTSTRHELSCTPIHRASYLFGGTYPSLNGSRVPPVSSTNTDLFSR